MKMAALLLLLLPPCDHAHIVYHWTHNNHASCLSDKFAPPAGFQRNKGSQFAEWLRHIPLLPEGSPVKSYNGTDLSSMREYAAVADIDVGYRDLQQCADAVIRMRAEYLYTSGRFEQIAFHYTSGDLIPFTRWTKGERPIVSGNKIAWKQGAETGSSHHTLRKYLDNIFSYAGTLSLRSEMKAVEEITDVQPGDVFVVGGSPGHAIMVADVIENDAGNKKMLLIQSYMPAQSIHVLRVPGRPYAWYDLPVQNGDLVTPDWTFRTSDLYRFR